MTTKQKYPHNGTPRAGISREVWKLLEEKFPAEKKSESQKGTTIARVGAKELTRLRTDILGFNQFKEKAIATVEAILRDRDKFNQEDVTALIISAITSDHPEVCLCGIKEISKENQTESLWGIATAHYLGIFNTMNRDQLGMFLREGFELFPEEYKQQLVQAMLGLDYHFVRIRCIRYVISAKEQNSFLMETAENLALQFIDDNNVKLENRFAVLGLAPHFSKETMITLIKKGLDSSDIFLRLNAAELVFSERIEELCKCAVDNIKEILEMGKRLWTAKTAWATAISFVAASSVVTYCLVQKAVETVAIAGLSATVISMLILAISDFVDKGIMKRNTYVNSNIKKIKQDAVRIAGLIPEQHRTGELEQLVAKARNKYSGEQS